MGGVEPRAEPVLVYVKPLNLRGYGGLVWANRIRKKLGHTMLPVEMSGNWSKKLDDFDLRRWYRVAETRRHFLEDVSWDQIGSVIKKRKKLNNGYYPSDVRSHEMLDQRLESHDKLFEAIRKDGGLSAAPEHLVQLNISETGGFYFGPGGQHRIAMAVVLGFESIPMKLGYVHTKGRGALGQLL